MSLALQSPVLFDPKWTVKMFNCKLKEKNSRLCLDASFALFCHDANGIEWNFVWDKLMISTVNTLKSDTADDPSVNSYLSLL